MKIGILGGGQLARMLIESSYKFGFDFKILANEEDSPAGIVTRYFQKGDFNNEADLIEFSKDCDVITLENEFIDYKKIEALEKLNKKVYPCSKIIKLIQDKLFQKDTLLKAGIPVADFVNVENKEDIVKFAKEHSYPVILKSRTMGYDGKGNYKIDSESDIEKGITTLKARGELMCEKFINFDKEIAVQAARNHKGEIEIFPVVETIQKNHICHIVRASKNLFDEKIVNEVNEITEKILEQLNYTGVIGIEMFLTTDNEILVNELAPRVHNSGHYTIEGCYTSQFENHIRAILDLPLGNTDMTAGSAVMINILGEKEGEPDMEDLSGILKHEKTYVHNYRKKKSLPGRKMGHITVLHDSLSEAEKIANECRRIINV
ncbi:MAG TPA: 5-(carboxyamino)imidazole ribonucleotide synthase [Ignavibacteria bacterium]|nr:5-(carboxyamino)imidazole ribonucleotide synthase [Ignavibacteria bacterium]